MNKINVLGVNFDNTTMKETVEKCNEFLKTGKTNLIVTPNPEIVMEARKDSEFKNLLNSADLCLPDGIGIIIASKILKTPLKERVPGFDAICSFLADETSKIEKKIYILGAKPGVAEVAGDEIEHKYKAKVVGFHHGYFDKSEEDKIVQDIIASGANVLLVGLGMGKQERFIFNHAEELKTEVAIGCGGSIDVLAGTVKRAPKIFRKLGLEWFYRLIKQPSRIGRMMQLPKFLLLVIFKGKKESI